MICTSWTIKVPPGAMSLPLEEQRLREEERWNEEQALAAEVRALQVRDPVRKGAEKWGKMMCT